MSDYGQVLQDAIEDAQEHLTRTLNTPDFIFEPDAKITNDVLVTMSINSSQNDDGFALTGDEYDGLHDAFDILPEATCGLSYENLKEDNISIYQIIFSEFTHSMRDKITDHRESKMDTTHDLGGLVL